MISNLDLRQARYARACWWLERGVAVVPLKPQSKALQPGYGARLAHIADPTFARQWFLNTDANLGVVLGGPAGLVVSDWDNAQAYETWRRNTGAGVETLTEQTTRGYHAFFVGEGLASAVGPGCEFKTSGICMVSPSVHPSGQVYCLVNAAPIAKIDHEQVRVLFPFLSEAPSKQVSNDWGDPATRRVLRKRPNARLVSDSIVARIKVARPIVDEMSAAGVKLLPGGKVTLVGLCPFHADHSPSLWANPESGLWGCNKPGCPAAGIHDVINFRAMHRGIPNSVAIKQLAKEVL